MAAPLCRFSRMCPEGAGAHSGACGRAVGLYAGFKMSLAELSGGAHGLQLGK